MRSGTKSAFAAALFGAVLVAAALAAPSGAAAQIFMPGTQPEGDDGGITTPLQTSGTCTRCHALYDDTDDYEPWDGWRGSMMGNAGRDPVFRAALAIAEQDVPDAADFCVRCHSFPAWLRGRSSLPEWTEADGPRLQPDEDFFPSDDLDGTACQTCHRASDDVPGDPDAPYAQNAQIYFYDGPEGAVRTGPYEYLPGGEPNHPTLVSTFLPQGNFCGQCHDIVNPIVMGERPDGTPTGRLFAIERTFSEWQHSDFGARNETCQDCHMREVGTPVRASEDGEDRDYVRRHDLVGSSSWVLRSLASTVPDTDGDWIEALERTAGKAEAFLTEAAELTVSGAALEGETASATVRVTNLTGHKLPTGYPEGRRMWLEVAIVDGTGAVTGGSGLYDATTGDLMHDDQLRSYEAELGVDGEPSFHFAINNTVLRDDRIPPEGFDPPEELDMTPVGRDYSDGAGGYNHWDETDYALPVCGEGELTLRVRLLFQSTTKEYIEFLRDNAPDSADPAIDNWGTIAYDQWLLHGGRTASLMAETEVVLGAAPVACPELPMDSGVTPDGGIDAGDAGADAGPPPDDGGCGCRVAAVKTDRSGSALVFGLVALAAIRRVRRRRR